MSKLPTPLQQQVSNIFITSLANLWESFSKLELEKLFPKIVKSSEYVQGSPLVLGSEVKITFKDNSEQIFKITELSLTQNKISFDIISASPALQVSSVSNAIICETVSEMNYTMICWKRYFSSDVNNDILQKNKLEIENLFQNLEEKLLDEKRENSKLHLHHYPNEYKQAKNILVMCGKADLVSWERANYVIQRIKKPRHLAPAHHFNYEKFIEMAESLYYSIYYVCKVTAKKQSKIDEKQDQQFKKLRNALKEQHQAQNIIHMLSKSDLESLDKALLVVKKQKKPQQQCDSDFDYEKFIQHFEKLYLQQFGANRKMTEQQFMNPQMKKKISKQYHLDFEANPYQQEKREARNMLVMLSRKDLHTWEQAKNIIESKKKIKSSCSEKFQYDKFIDFVQQEYIKIYGGLEPTMSRKSSSAFDDEQELEELMQKRYQTGIINVHNQASEYIMERDQAQNILAMLKKSDLQQWETTEASIKIKKPNDREHCGDDFNYEQFIQEAKKLYIDFYAIPTSPQKKRSEVI